MRRSEHDETYAEDDEFYVDQICENVRFPHDEKEHKMHGDIIKYKLTKTEIENLEYKFNKKV